METGKQKLMENYKFFINDRCEFFPCHELSVTEWSSCLFCYCPLYLFRCGGTYEMLSNGSKDCTPCNIPHRKEGWDIIQKELSFHLNKIPIPIGPDSETES